MNKRKVSFNSNKMSHRKSFLNIIDMEENYSQTSNFVNIVNLSNSNNQIREPRIRYSTSEFLEGVVKRLNDITNDSIQKIDLNKIRDRIKSKSNLDEEIVEIIDLDHNDKKKTNNEDNLIIDLNSNICSEKKFFKDEELIFLQSDLQNHEEEIQVISHEEYLKNLSEFENKIQEQGAFQCGICYSSKLKMDTRIFECGHEFCNKCAIRWMKCNWTCPLCRARLNKW
jgi:hypothetical protein